MSDRLRRFFSPLVLLGVAWLAGPAWALERVTLQLKWTHAFQFAGYYAAQELGYYREAGLEVTIREALPGTDPTRVVVDGQAQYGVGTSSLLLARGAGQPVVVLAAIFQHSPMVLIVRSDGATQTIHDLVGKRVMLEPQSDELVAYLRQERIPPERLTVIPHSFSHEELVAGRVDAMSAYVTNEPYYLDRLGFRYQIYTPRSAGIDFYGDNLFTSEEELAQHPERVRAFLEASLRGWRYAMTHPEELADLIMARYSSRVTRDFLLDEARRMAPLLRAELIEIGYMNPGRWRHIADVYADLGLLPRDYPLGGFLYDTRPAAPDLTWLYLALGLLTVVSGIAVYVHRVNRRLAASMAESEQRQSRIQHMAQHDALTDLPNRALFSDRLGQAINLARRHGQRLAVIFIDLDKFKPINDELGHQVGDMLLRKVADRLRAVLRESDTVARIGGDEFLVLLMNVRDGAGALAVAEKLHQAVRQPYWVEGHELVLSASLGVALYPDHGETEILLTKHADDAMYLAKGDGQGGARLYQAEDGTA